MYQLAAFSSPPSDHLASSSAPWKVHSEFLESRDDTARVRLNRRAEAAERTRYKAEKKGRRYERPFSYLYFCSKMLIVVALN